MTQSNFENLINKGESAFERGDITYALTTFQAALTLDKHDKRLLNNLGVIHFQLGKPDLSRVFFNRALDEDRYYLNAFLNLSKLLKSQNKIFEIHSRFNVITKKIKNDPELAILGEELKKGFKYHYKQLHHGNLESTGEEGDKDKIFDDVKILHAPLEIAGNMARITGYLRDNGIEARCTNYSYGKSWLGYKCDEDLELYKYPNEQKLTIIDSYAKEAIEMYDIFHFHFAHTLYPDYRDLEIIKDKDKKILCSFWGSDQRGIEWIFYQQAKFLGYKPPKPYFLTVDLYQKHKLLNNYADVMFGLYCIPRGIYNKGIFQMEKWPLEEKERFLRENLIKKDPDLTYFVHAPTSNVKKGTAILLKLMEECKAEGMPIELILVQNKTNEEARKIYAYADYALDQVGAGSFGLFGSEMMAWKIPVLVNQIPLADKLKGYPPAISITKDNFKETILNCIAMKKTGELEDLGNRSRLWIKNNFDFSVCGPEYIDIYSKLIRGEYVPQTVNTAWYQEEKNILNGVKSDFFRYMIEENVFPEIGVEVTAYDKRLYN